MAGALQLGRWVRIRPNGLVLEAGSARPCCAGGGRVGSPVRRKCDGGVVSFYTGVATSYTSAAISYNGTADSYSGCGAGRLAPTALGPEVERLALVAPPFPSLGREKIRQRRRTGASCGHTK